MKTRDLILWVLALGATYLVVKTITERKFGAKTGVPLPQQNKLIPGAPAGTTATSTRATYPGESIYDRAVLPIASEKQVFGPDGKGLGADFIDYLIT